jgi:hypothetical protein
MYEPGLVDILDPITNEVVNQCYGPAREGICPQAGRNGVVLCQGCRVAGKKAGPEYWNIWVPPDSQQCPRAWTLEVLGY